MEVHHHSHTARKKWTHYFWEFLMLFLAVFCGFLAEYKLEHTIEHERGKKYAAFLYDDLRKDTLLLSTRTQFMQNGIAKLDTLIAALQHFTNADSAITKIYTLSTYAYAAPFFGATTSTLEQLKFSGSLRYFKNNKLIRSFTEYDNDLNNLKYVEQMNTYLAEEMRKFLVQFLDLNYIPRYISDSTGIKLVNPQSAEGLKIYRIDKPVFEQYANLCRLKQFDWANRIGLQKALLHSGKELITSLNKEYRLSVRYPLEK